MQAPDVNDELKMPTTGTECCTDASGGGAAHDSAGDGSCSSEDSDTADGEDTDMEYE